MRVTRAMPQIKHKTIASGKKKKPTLQMVTKKDPVVATEQPKKSDDTEHAKRVFSPAVMKKMAVNKTLWQAHDPV